MPANENTWRKLSILHMVFGLSSIAMLLATVWMLAVDHRREWKNTQSDFRRIERVMFDWRAHETRTQEYQKQVDDLEAKLAKARAQLPDSNQIIAYTDALAAHALFAHETPPPIKTLDQPGLGAGEEGPDGRLLESELPADIRSLFALLDLDNSGALDVDEVFHALQKLPADKSVPFRAWAKSQVDGIEEIDAGYEALRAAARGSKQTDPEEWAALAKPRNALFADMKHYAVTARDQHNVLFRELKVERANRDKTNSVFQLAITAGEPRAKLDVHEDVVRLVERRVDRLAMLEQQAKGYRDQLEGILAKLQHDETTLNKELNVLKGQLADLQKARDQRDPNWLLERPIADAFNSPLKIEQVWTPNLKVNYNLAWVARFDRCVTCHQGIDKTMAGSPSEPLYPPQGAPLTILLATPKTRPVVDPDASASDITDLNRRLRVGYGLDLANEGLFPGDVAISAVWSAKDAARNQFSDAAARANLLTGDVIDEVEGNKITTRETALRYLLESAEWGKPLKLTIRRGLPQPFSTHPRLDLYLGSFSPHKIMDFGCTVCHQGQGSATTFKYSSHTPNTPLKQAEWEKKHGWFSSHDWPFLMYPQRFVESSCIKCHHEVTELEPSKRFPDPPAPKVVDGYQLIRRFGCFGCHEINGFDGPATRIGPDLRAEPNYYAAAQQLLADPAFAELKKASPGDTAGDAQQRLLQAKSLAESVVANPERDDLRKKLANWIMAEGHRGMPSDVRTPAGAAIPLTPASQAMASILGADNETPGKYRKPGPSLRYIASKNDQRFLYDWIKNPKHFRPSTRMPQFFGLHDHLPGPDGITVDGVRDWAAVSKSLSDAGAAILKARQQSKAELEKTAQEKAPALPTPAGQIWLRLPGEAQRDLALAGSSNPGSGAARERVVAALNGLLHDRELYDAEVFASVPIRGDASAFLKSVKDNESTRTVLKRDPGDLSKREVEWLNRWLIEAAFPDKISPSERALDQAYRFEPIEALAASHYLLAASQPFEYAKAAQPGSAERGKLLFQTRGCLACHSQEASDVVRSKANQGPDLSQLGAKLQGQKGRDWLYSWVREPSRYHARTVMPNLFLTEIESKDAEGKVTVTDPAADIAEYLLTSQKWEAYPVPTLDEKDAADMQALDRLVMLYLEKSFPRRQAEKYLAHGIPQEEGSKVRGDEVSLVGPISIDKKLEYIGRRTIGRLGCAGCHDIPGYEDSKPIGTGLNAWGRKETSQLAFEQIASYLGISHGGHGGGAAHPKSHIAEDQAAEADDSGHPEGALAGHGVHKVDIEVEQNNGFYLESLGHHHREGFIWQKIRSPRSYDHQMTGHKGYDERLRMPQFAFTPAQREAIITFVLGLVADPTDAKTAKYVYHPSPNAKALLEGKQVLDKFNCAGCHTMQMERWRFDYDPDQFAANQKVNPPGVAPVAPGEDYKSLHPYFTPEQLKQSQEKDRRGLAHGEVSGWKTGEPQVDDDDRPFNYYELWEPVALGGEAFRPTQQVPILDSQITKHYPARGGEFARLIHPLVLGVERKTVNPAAKDTDAWGWLPPPLVREGRKVQTEWLYRFLLNPYPIRPAVVLRMPQFHMSPEDARKLVNYFAAEDNVEYPYESVPQRESSYLAGQQAKYPNYFPDTFKIVADGKQGCTQCHYVGDYVPAGNPKAHAPNLTEVRQRVRPEWLGHWLARPKEYLPYTGMPSNFPLDKAMHQDKLKAPAEEQIQAMRDLLLNFDRYIGGQEEVSIKSRVKIPPPTETAPPAASGGQ